MSSEVPFAPLAPGGALALHRVDSPLGEVLLATDGDGATRALDFHDYEPRLRNLVRLHYGAIELHPAPAPATLQEALRAYFSGDLGALESVPVAAAGTPFRHRVWSLLRRIPPGEAWSYGRVAVEIGAPAAVRAVGAANGANPIALLVPCHRVLGSGGSLTGYGGGVHRKQWLLEHEKGHRVLSI